MAFTAAQAKKNTADWMIKAQRENKEYNRKRLAREKRASVALWKTRGAYWVKKIDTEIKNRSKHGGHHTYLPSSCSPNGDSVIWLAKTDEPIHELLMEHYRNHGFEVKEYSPLGLEISW